MLGMAVSEDAYRVRKQRDDMWLTFPALCGASLRPSSREAERLR